MVNKTIKLLNEWYAAQKNWVKVTKHPIHAVKTEKRKKK